MTIEHEWIERDVHAENERLNDPNRALTEAQRIQENYWRLKEPGLHDLLTAVNDRLRSRQDVPVNAKDVREIDRLKTFELGHFEDYLERTYTEMNEMALDTGNSPEMRAAWKAEAERLMDKTGPAARERIETWFESFRTDLATGQHTPLWARQKLWAAVIGSLFAGGAMVAGLLAVYAKLTSDDNVARAKARGEMLQREFALDAAQHEALLALAKSTLADINANAFTKYLGWMRDTQKAFHLGLMTLRELMLDFSIQIPTHAPIPPAVVGVPFTSADVATIETAMLAKYTSATDATRSYALIIDELQAQGTTFPDLAKLTAAQLNYFLAGVLDALRKKMEDGSAEPPHVA